MAVVRTLQRWRQSFGSDDSERYSLTRYLLRAQAIGERPSHTDMLSVGAVVGTRQPRVSVKRKRRPALKINTAMGIFPSHVHRIGANPIERGGPSDISH